MSKDKTRSGKKLGWILLILLILWVISFKKVVAQAPLGVNYQGIARNMDGTPKSEKSISIRVSILEGGISGIAEYSEIHEVQTNQFGLFTLVIGQGDHVGSIQDIDWSSGNKWLQIEMDTEGGTNFDVIGAQQIYSVPYAMYATQAGTGLEAGAGIAIVDGIVENISPDQPLTLLGAGNVTVTGSYPDYIISGADNINDADSDPTNEIQTMTRTGDDLTLSNEGGNVSIKDGDSEADNEIQTMNQVGSSVTLSNGGGTITINDPDSNPTNELITSVQLNGSNLEIVDSGGSFITDLSSLTNTNDIDPANELQTLSQMGSSVTLSNGGGTINVDDGDADSGNELQTIDQTGSLVTLSDGGGTISVDDPDADPLNELQTLVQAGDNVTLSSGGGTISVADGDADSGNELQTISQTGSSVTLSNGGGTITVDDDDADSGNEIQNLSNTVSGTNRTIDISGGSGTTFSVADNDNDPLNEIQNAGQVVVTPSGNLTSTNVQSALVELQTDINADNDQNSSNEIQNLSSSASSTNRTIDISGGAGTTISIADLDNNPSNEIQNLSDVLSENNNAGGNKITGLADPVGSSDAVTKNYLDVKDATDYAFKSFINASGTGTAIIFDLSSTSFDEGPLILGQTITILESGVYQFTVKGSSTSNAPIVVSVNGTDDYSVGLINVNKYFDTILLNLTIDDTVELRANSTVLGEIFILEFFGFKI